MIRVEVCGNIASGKTSLIHAFRREFPSKLCALFERYREVPFWMPPGDGREVYELGRTLGFLLHHAHVVLNSSAARDIICDFAFFENLAYASLMDDQKDVSLIRSVYERLESQLPKLSLIISLICKPSTLFRRIRSRDRVEESTISERYLLDLGRAIECELQSVKRRTGVPVITVDTDETDYVTDRRTVRTVWKEVQSVIISRKKTL